MSFRGREFGSFRRGRRRGNRGGSNRNGGYDQGPPEQVTGKKFFLSRIMNSTKSCFPVIELTVLCR